MSSRGDLRGPQLLRGVSLGAAPVRLASPFNVAAEPVEDGSASLAALERQAVREQALREAHEEGLRSGRAEGLRQGRAEAAAELRAAIAKAVEESVAPLRAEQERLRQLGDALQSAAGDAVLAAQDDMVALAFDAICRILGEHALRPEVVRAQVAHLVARHATRETVALHVHPDDVGLLAQCQPDARWLADPEVTPGGCLLRSAGGTLDARLDTMLAGCREALLQARSGAGA